MAAEEFPAGSESKAQCVSIFQITTCVTFSNVPLTRASSMAKPTLNRWRNSLHLLVEGEAESQYKGAYIREWEEWCSQVFSMEKVTQTVMESWVLLARLCGISRVTVQGVSNGVKKMLTCVYECFLLIRIIKIIVAILITVQLSSFHTQSHLILTTTP